ncbi:uncharacterized protein LOC119600390 [Lucilia sericata]|uniref:uncharacterized protein LOC119600390 n=1 Tax=Lucilia sericata TaxID=13632 RepID=UPI0018A8017A|nr:uncharacterized protein LOC119600390 [Lucilia sericata]
MKTIQVIALWYTIATLAAFCWSLPVLEASSGIDNDTIEDLRASINDSPKNLYVVKAVVYEIGILTEVDDNDTTSFESQERVDLTFFDAHTNESHIDLGNIPLPIQTNVSGQVLTGIAPVNIGAISSASELLQTLPLTGSIVNITHSDTAFYKLTKSNVSDEEKPRIVNMDEIASIPEAAALFPSSASSSLQTDGIVANSVESR